MSDIVADLRKIVADALDHANRVETNPPIVDCWMCEELACTTTVSS